jgi:hypothetical protein
MANGWALGKFGGEFAQVTQTYVGQLQSFGSLTDITSGPRERHAAVDRFNPPGPFSETKRFKRFYFYSASLERA